MNIFLIGMMGSGKSAVGAGLAHAIGYNFVDTDISIENDLGQSIDEIFAHFGEKYFRQVESRIFTGIATQDNYVVATGGGIILAEENRQHLKRCGTTVWLETDIEILAGRIKKDTATVTKRPLIVKEQQVSDYLHKIYSHRKQLYQQCADIIICTDFLSVAETIQEIKASIYDRAK
jgi:shikimate kinase